MKPFRWDIRRREQLGQLADGTVTPERHSNLEEELRDLSASIIDAAGDSDLAFVGRSPESMFGLNDPVY